MMARGAERIAAARKAHKRPSDMVIVSLAGPLDERNPVVIANWKDDYEWWWVKGLQICLFCRPGSPWRRTLTAIAAHRPSFLALWDVVAAQGAYVYWLPTLASIEAVNGPDRWKWELSFVEWTDAQNRDFDDVYATRRVL